ncbi:MAG: transporter substrate-binding domain-containing protein [Planctomycetes bacterium]|nr:transporter substrate-binding domain-containing protein [Planctomycetota bacterium]
MGARATSVARRPRAHLLLCALAALTTLAARPAERVVRVGLHPAQPLVYRDDDGRPAGFAVDVLEVVAALEGWSLDWVDGDWDTCEERLRTGEIDLLFPIRDTPERLEVFDFTSRGMLTTWGDVFVRRDSEVESLLDLDGRTVAVVRGDYFATSFDATLRSFARSCSYLPLASCQDVMAAVRDGDADAGVLERLTGYWHMDAYGLVTPTFPFGPSELLLAVPKGRNADLIEALDRRLLEQEADPSSAFARIRDEWFRPRPADEGIPGWLIVTLAVVAGLALVSAAFGAVLRRQLAVRTAQLDARASELQRETADRVRAEQHREQLEAQLRHSQKLEAIGQLAAGVAHDFRNLLTVISAHTDRIATRVSDDALVAESVDALGRAVDQAAQVTRSLLGFSRRMEPRREALDLCACVDEAARMLARTLPAAIQLTVKTALQPRPHVLADPTQMHQVILNLALNARDAMPRGGRLEIAVERRYGDTREVTVRVSDTGEGMSPEVRARIFEPFFTTKEESGTGLGLATVQGIVTEHGGRVSVSSAEGRGTSFVLHFPLLPDPLPGADSDPSGVPAAEGCGELVLLAEDDRQVRQIVAAALIAAGYEVVQAKDGHQALERGREERGRIRLCVFDVDMPQLSGLDALAALRAEGESAPAILVTASEIALDAAASGSDTVVLSKPFAIQELCTLVREMLDRAHVEDA